MDKRILGNELVEDQGSLRQIHRKALDEYLNALNSRSALQRDISVYG